MTTTFDSDSTTHHSYHSTIHLPDSGRLEVDRLWSAGVALKVDCIPSPFGTTRGHQVIRWAWDITVERIGDALAAGYGIDDAELDDIAIGMPDSRPDAMFQEFADLSGWRFVDDARERFDTEPGMEELARTCLVIIMEKVVELARETVREAWTSFPYDDA